MAKGKKSGLKWVKQTLELEKEHHWQSKAGYKIFVAGRGAVRLDIPQDWKFEANDKSFWFTDDDPPDENARLEVSYNLLKSSNSLKDLPLIGILNKVLKEDSRNVIERSRPVTVPRQTARIVWGEIKFIDSVEDREAYSRIGIGIGSNVQCLVTFDYWVDDAERMIPVWDVAMESLTLGLYIRDPRTGLAFPD